MALANGFVERMQAGKERAASLRARGIATGGKVKAVKRAELPPFDKALFMAKQNLASTVSAILEEYERAVFPERYTVDDLPWPDDSFTLHSYMRVFR